MSNYPKEIQLDDDDVSHHDFFLRPRLPDQSVHGLPSLRSRKSNCAIASEMDDNELEELPESEFHTTSPVQGEDKSEQLPTADNSRGEDDTRKTISNLVLNSNPKLSEEDISQEQSFTKNEGKLIFKITRYNRVTQKEKLITKNRRIISKCPHTSLKYYAKGMCK